jgi:hypothetical protein
MAAEILYVACEIKIVVIHCCLTGESWGMQKTPPDKIKRD